MLKKAAAFFFITLFLFNLFGYRLVVEYMQQRVSTRLDERLDNNDYSDAQLMELKLPLHLPYQTDWSGYQRCNGEIELNGMIYTYVKRKVASDTLFLLCIPNVQKTHLETAKNDFFRLSNGLVDNRHSDDSKISLKSLQGDYDEYLFTIPSRDGSSLAGCIFAAHKAGILSSSHSRSPEQPPESPIA